MREPNLGITTICSICGRSFWCEDGYSICSSACDDELERIQEEEEREEERQDKIRLCEEAQEEFGCFEDDDFEAMDDDELEKAYDFAYELLYLK